MDFTKQMMNYFRNYKLGDSLFRSQIQLRHEELKSEAIDHELRIKRKLFDNISDMMRNKFSYKKEENYMGVIYSTELLILKMEDFKTIVESAISLMTDDQIQQVKNGKTFKDLDAK